MHQASELWFKAILHEHRRADRRARAHAKPAQSLWRMRRINALMRIVSAQLSSLETLPPQHFAQFRTLPRHVERLAERAVPRDRGGVRAARRALHAGARGARRDSRSSSQRALARPTLQELFLALLDAQSVELEDAVPRAAADDAVLPRRGAARVRAAVRGSGGSSTCSSSSACSGRSPAGPAARSARGI